MRTRSGRVSRLTSYLEENYNINLQDKNEEHKMNNLQHGISLTPAEQIFYNHMRELNKFGLFSIDKESHELETKYGLVGAAAGNQFSHTGQLKVMSYNKAMKTPEKEEWDKAVHKEHITLSKYLVWKAVPKHKVPDDAKIITTI
eukprot:8276728-Ditylum_brightwellii.AAC.2